MTRTVIIAGGGPVGLLVAAELRLNGVPALVLERRTHRETEAFSRLLHGRSADVLDRRGLLAGLGELPRWPAVHFAHLPMDLGKASPDDCWLIVPQNRVEAALEDRAVALGTEIRRGHEVLAVEQDDGGVTVTVRGVDGEYRVEGAFLVGADGGNSTVREAAGFVAPPRGPSWYGLVAQVEGYAGPEGAATGPAGLYGVIPDAGFHHVMTTEFARDTPGHEVPVTFEEVRASVLRVAGAPVTGGRPRWMARYGNVTRLPDSYRKGRVVLVGDAAHTHFHAVGHGLNTGLNDAVNLGWKLAAEADGTAPEGLLDSYEAERRPVGERAVRVMLAQLALLHPLEPLEPLRSLLAELVELQPVVEHLVGAVTTVRYPLELDLPGDSSEFSPLIGRSLPVLPEAAAPAVHSGGGVLLAREGDPRSPGPLPNWAGRVTRVEIPAVPELDAPGVLVRPDGVVAWAGTDDKGLTAALETWFGPAAH
ncbi:FAD-dependent monooxygenase [Streptomyces sp. NPDC006465]|uniref:FAD-dependent monooxygenase n=1 Tax=Streptomyces sp. NPDC006465 TaxID=3157174 RepID=UPI0033A502AE